MAENQVSEVFANSVKRNLNDIKDPTFVSSQLNLLGYNLNTAFAALNSIRGSFDGACFDSLSQQEKSNLQKTLSEIDDCVHVLQQQLQANLQNSIELTSQNDAVHCSLTDDGHPDAIFSPSPRIPSSSIDVIIGRPIDDSESETFNGKHLAGTVIAPVPVANNAYERSNNGYLVEAGRGTEAPRNGNGKSSVRRFSQQAGSLFSWSGSAIHPKPTTIAFSNLNNENSQQRPKTSENSVQPPEKGVEVAATEGWIKSTMDAFKLIDINNDGFLQKEEVSYAIKELQASGGIDLSANTMALAEELMKEVDENGDGEIDINEFVEMMKKSFYTAIEDDEGKRDATNMGKMLLNKHRMSQLARNVLLAHQVKVENSVEGRDLWLIHPLGKLNVYWNILISSFIALTVVTMPLSLGWNEVKKAMLVVHLIIDAFFFLDVLKNFFTGILDENDKIIMDAKLVRWKYFTHYFLADLFSSIPFDVFLATSGRENSLIVVIFGFKHGLKMAKLFRLSEVVRLTRASHMFDSINLIFIRMEEKMNFHIPDGYAKLWRLGFGALLLGHWIGCLNFMLVRLYDFPHDSWVVAAGLRHESVYVQWSWSFFKALAQMVMIGFQTPPFTNVSCLSPSEWCTIEHWVTLGCLYVGALFYSLLISSMSSILEVANKASEQFQQKLAQIEDYMRNKKLPPSLREKVKEYFRMQHSEGKLYDENEILETITPVMRREIQAFNGRAISSKVPLLNSITNKSFAEEIAIELKPSYAFQDEILIKENTVGKEMYFILNGIVELFVSRSMDNSAYVTIGDGCYFGEVALILGCRRTATAKTKTQCVLYTLNRDSLLNILEDYPATSQYMKKIAASRQRRVRHFLNPSSTKLAPEDEIDLEDSKTELVGVAKSLLLNKKLQSKNML